MNVGHRIGVVLALVTVALVVASGQTTQVPEVGWLGLFNRGLTEALENENRLAELCPGAQTDSSAWLQCKDEKLAPRIYVVRLRNAPRDAAALIGSLTIVATPGQGLRAFFVPEKRGVATEFRPDLFDGDWGYGPYFHQTFVERRGTWFRLAAVPFPEGTWLNATELSDLPDIRRLEVDQIVESPWGDLRILGLAQGTLRARPEQEADMWCDTRDPPPLKPWRELRMSVRDLYTPSGHLVLRVKYTRGC